MNKLPMFDYSNLKVNDNVEVRSFGVMSRQGGTTLHKATVNRIMKKFIEIKVENGTLIKFNIETGLRVGASKACTQTLCVIL